MTRSLTQRELQIARLAAAGKTNHEIAKELGIGARTVEWNLTRVFRKLRIHSRADLAAAVTPWAAQSEEGAERPIVTGESARDTQEQDRCVPGTLRSERGGGCQPG